MGGRVSTCTLEIGQRKLTVAAVESEGRYALRLTFADPVKPIWPERYGVLVRGTDREPVGLSLSPDPHILLASLIY